MKNETWKDERIERMMGAQVRSTSARFDQEAERFLGSLKEPSATTNPFFVRWAVPALAAAMTVSLVGVFYQMNRKSDPSDLYLEDLVWMDETLDLGEAVLEIGNLEILEMLTWSVKNS